jgi:hypothetical protein
MKESVFVKAADSAYNKASAAVEKCEAALITADEAIGQIGNIGVEQALLAVLELEAALDNGEKLLDEAEAEANL